jgi:hypothetical protein
MERHAEFCVSYPVRKPTGNELMEYISKMHRNNTIITEYCMEMASCINFFSQQAERLCVDMFTSGYIYIYRIPGSWYKSEMFFLRGTVQALPKAILHDLL